MVCVQTCHTRLSRGLLLSTTSFDVFRYTLTLETVNRIYLSETASLISKCCLKISVNNSINLAAIATFATLAGG